VKIIDCEQRSPEWHTIRLGIPTASNFHRILTAIGKISAQREDYLYQLVTERIIGQDVLSIPETISSVITDGVEREEESRLIYAMHTESVVQQVGFCLSDCGRYGCSPDGLIGDDGLVELKNPTAKTAVKYLHDKQAMVKTYFVQVQGQLLVTNRAWCDLFCYYPGLQPVLVKVARDEDYIATLKVEIERFCEELDDATLNVKSKYHPIGG